MKTKTRKDGSVVEMSKTGRSPRPVAVRIEEASRPRMEVIACMANCAGLPETGIRFTFDLRDNLTGRVYTSLNASKFDGQWHIDGVWPKELPEGEDLPVLVALSGKRNFVEGEEHEYLERFTAVSEELNRWSRNLFALAEEESELDEGFEDYKQRLAFMEKLFTRQRVPRLGDEIRRQRWKWPLRPTF